MDRIIDAAAYVAKKYTELSGEKIDEMKLHKLLYFIQREAFAITGERAFDGTFEGWRYGPVCQDVRANFFNGEIECETEDISDQLKYIANNVILEYGPLATWKLSELTHQDISWKNARKGLSSAAPGNVPLKLEDIRKDAEKIRPYDHIWDMYYDEFEDEVVS